MKFKAFLPVVSSAFLFSSAAHAVEWQSFGPRSMAMGGTGVAFANGPVGAYWNPAGMAEDDSPSGFQAPVGVAAGATGSALAGAKDLSQIIQDCSGNNGTCTFSDIANINTALNELSASGSGALLDAQGGLDFKYDSFTFFVNELVYGGGNPYVDRTDISPCATVNCASNGAPNPNYILNNNSGLVYNILAVTEVGVGYAHEIPYLDGLFAGANVKGLIGNVTFDQKEAAEGYGSGYYFSIRNGESQTNIKPAADVGLLWDAAKSFDWIPLRPRLGLTFRNLGNPSFDQADGVKSAPVCQPGQQPTQNNVCVLIAQPGALSLGQQTRAGIALSPFHWWNISADMDLKKNQTYVNGYNSKMIGVGTEVNFFDSPDFNFPVRVGLERNVAQSGSPSIVTGGFGINFRHFRLDFAGEISPSMQSVQTQGSSKKIPEEIGGSVQLSIMFGNGHKKSSNDNS